MLAFYADESGTFSVRAGDQPWVVLLAIGFDDDHWATIDDALNDLKRQYFPERSPRDVEIKSHGLRMAHVRPRAENAFSSLSRDALRRFGEDLYSVIERLPFAWCASVLHKPSVVHRMPGAAGGDLFIRAYLDLLPSLDLWCRCAGKAGRLFVDQREARLHGSIHAGIVREHEGLREAAPARGSHVVERPYFHDSARSNHIQLADVIAYNVLRRVRDGDARYPYYRRIAAKRARFVTRK